MSDIRERHAKGAMPARCHHDHLDWPCDTAIVFAELDKAKAAPENASAATAAHEAHD